MWWAACCTVWPRCARAGVCVVVDMLSCVLEVCAGWAARSLCPWLQAMGSAVMVSTVPCARACLARGLGCAVAHPLRPTSWGGLCALDCMPHGGRADGQLAEPPLTARACGGRLRSGGPWCTGSNALSADTVFGRGPQIVSHGPRVPTGTHAGAMHGPPLW